MKIYIPVNNRHSFTSEINKFKLKSEKSDYQLKNIFHSMHVCVWKIYFNLMLRETIIKINLIHIPVPLLSLPGPSLHKIRYSELLTGGHASQDGPQPNPPLVTVLKLQQQTDFVTAL